MARRPEKHNKRHSSRPTARQLLGRVILLLLAVAIIVALPAAISRVKQWYSDKKNPAPAIDIDPGKDKEKKPLVVTEAEFKEAVLGRCRETGNYEVFEQEVSIKSELSQAFLGWKVFQKTKSFTTFGTGYYAVDLSQVQIEKVEVNVLRKQIYIIIPRSFLLALEPNYEATKFEDTEHALLAFGDVKLTAEQQNQVETEIMAKLREKLESVSCTNRADTAALTKCRELFEPVVQALDPSYHVTVKFGG